MRVCLPYTSKSEKDFDYVLSHFKPDVIYVLCKEGDKLTDTNVLGKGERIESYKELPDLPKVFLAPKRGLHIQGNISLIDYKHREECIYIVGENQTHTQREIFDELPEDLVYIPTSSKDEMFNYVALAVCLYDRLLKNG